MTSEDLLMSTEVGTWLRQQREARAWSKREMARRIISAGKAAGDTSLPTQDHMCRNVYRWERNESGLTERYRFYYCKAFGIPVSQFGSQAPAPELADPRLPTALPVAYRGREESGLGDSAVEQEVLMAAHEGSEHAEQAERRDIGDSTLEQLHADVARLSVEFMTGEQFPLFREMRRVRARMYRLLEGQLRPGDQADLYFLLGCLSGLMAPAASELGYPQAAQELIRAGWAYATAIDHKPLMAQLRLQFASIVFWYNRPNQARDLALDGLRYVSDGPTAAHLYVKHARAVARLGDLDAARRAISAAQEARGRGEPDELTAMGGEFSLSAATQSYFSGSALAELRGAETEAAEQLELALAAYDAGPGPGEQHWFAGKALAGIDLAVIRLRSGSLDAAAAALESPLSLVPAQRINAVTTRLDMVRTELAAPIFQRSPHARELNERLEEYAGDAIAEELHSLFTEPG